MFDIREQDLPLDGKKAGKSADLQISDADIRNQRLNELMAAALSGNVSRGRALKYWENLKLNPVHLQMLVMRAAGYRNNEIAYALDYEPSRVSVIVNHPDAQAVTAALVSYQAENLLDIKARIQAHAGEALNVVLDVMRNAENEAVKAKAAFSLLDRAGYGAVQRTETKVDINIPQRVAEGLEKALTEAAEVEDADWEFQDALPAPAEQPRMPEADLHSGSGEPNSEGTSSETSSEPPTVSYADSPHFQPIRKTA